MSIPSFGQESIVSIPQYEKFDMNPLYQAKSNLINPEIIKDISKYRLIGLGESSHGSGELFKLKAKIIMDLIRTGAVRTILFETDHTTLIPLNDFLQDDRETDTYSAFKASGIYRVYYTSEVFDLIKEIKTYNLSHEDTLKVSISGIDMQNPANILKEIRLVVSSIDNFKDQQIINDLVKLEKSVSTKPKKWLTKKDKHEFDSNLSKLMLIGQNDLGSKLTFYTTLLSQSLQLYNEKNKFRYNVLRDRFMSECTLELLKTLPKVTTAVLWAHNSHLALESYLKVSRMGFYLNKALDQDYFPIAINFKEGYSRMLKMERSKYHYENVFYSASDNLESVEYLFESSPIANFYINFRTFNNNSQVSKAIDKFPYMRLSGAAVLEGSRQDYYHLPARKNFRALLFCNYSDAAVPFK